MWSIARETISVSFAHQFLFSQKNQKRRIKKHHFRPQNFQKNRHPRGVRLIDPIDKKQPINPITAHAHTEKTARPQVPGMTGWTGWIFLFSSD
jgi:hypothetical protein